MTIANNRSLDPVTNSSHSCHNMCSDSLHHAGSSRTHVIPAMIFNRFSDSWHCQQMMYSFDFLVPAKISGRIGPGKVYGLSTWLYISIYFYFEDEICAMQLQDVSFEQIFPLSELQIEVRNKEVWSLWLTRWNYSSETCGNLWKLWVLISDWSKIYERQGGRRNTYIEF